MPSPERGGQGPDEPDHQPRFEREPTPYLRAARFAGEQPAREAYVQARAAIFTGPPNDLSAYRLQLDRVFHVAVVGSRPPAELDERILAILRAGEPTTLPDD